MPRAWLPQLCALCFSVVVAATARSAAGQELTGVPEYAPLNPIIAARSGLGSQAYRDRLPGWSFALSLDYGSATEVDSARASYYVLDAEIGRAGFTATRDLDATHFLLVQGGVMRAHAGFADAFFDGFHRLIAYEQRSRASRPRNAFAYRIVLPAGERVEYVATHLELTDVRVGVGRRHNSYVQSIASITLPTSTAPEGYRRGVLSLNVVTTVRAAIRQRTVIEASLGGGYTPTHGALAAAQRPAFFSASSGVLLRAWRMHALYGTVFYHSPVYRDLALPELDRGQLTIDFGAVIASHGRQWRIGLVEDTRATDGGIDLILKLGTVW